jgi:hypothetical protein
MREATLSSSGDDDEVTAVTAAATQPTTAVLFNMLSSGSVPERVALTGGGVAFDTGCGM